MDESDFTMFFKGEALSLSRPVALFPLLFPSSLDSLFSQGVFYRSSQASSPPLLHFLSSPIAFPFVDCSCKSVMKRSVREVALCRAKSSLSFARVHTTILRSKRRTNK